MEWKNYFIQNSRVFSHDVYITFLGKYSTKLNYISFVVIDTKRALQQKFFQEIVLSSSKLTVFSTYPITYYYVLHYKYLHKNLCLFVHCIYDASYRFRLNKYSKCILFLLVFLNTHVHNY